MSASPARPAATDPVSRYVLTYGDLLFDLCESLLWSPIAAQIAFRKVVKTLQRRSKSKAARFHTYERPWVLRTALEVLRPMIPTLTRKLTQEDRIELDSNPHVSNRLKQFDAYFHRLNFEEQALLLLKDKYGLPISEIATAFEIHEDSLKVMRQQALQSLEDWIWEKS